MIHSVTVCGSPFSVVQRRLTPEESDAEDREDQPYGKVFVVERLIVLSPEVPPARVDEVIAHEVMHAVLHLSGMAELLGPKREEAVCTAAELMWAAMVGTRVGS